MKQITSLPYLLLALSTPVFAAGPENPQSSGEVSDSEVTELKEFVITATPLPMLPEDLTLPATVLSGDELSLRVQNSLGETLAWEPGVNSTFYSQGASRPIIRGFEGDRIRVLQSGLDSLDVSNTSPDHAVAIEPLFTERIEVVRGPSTLLYGSSAIGGVVNVIGNHIPLERSEEPVTGVAEFRYDSVSDGKNGGGFFPGLPGADCLER